ncbi:MAG: ATP-binding protein [Candidatus Kapabacteria bacterium]|nr:ATP-binding protein [Candidatus Kapabacteria bacterium]
MKTGEQSEYLKTLVSELIDNPHTKKMFSTMRRNYFIRLILIYVLPLFLLISYFFYQYNDLMSKSRELHLQSIAESKSRLLDIYLIERVNNVVNAIENPELKYPLDSMSIHKIFVNLKKNNDAFTDIGYFDTTSIQKLYSGPLPQLINKDYKNEVWFQNLISSEKKFIITDIYLGFRKAPHFTIGVKKVINGKHYVFRVSLDPQKIYSYMTSTEKAKDVNILIINQSGLIQLAPKHISEPMKASPFQVPQNENLGISHYNLEKNKRKFAFSRLNEVNWAVITIEKEESMQSFFNQQVTLIIASLAIIILLVLIIFFRSKNIVEIEKERILVRLQLEQASKLATVGELASGIAHEIGNPLNIIANEIGLMQDYIDPKFGYNLKIEELEPHFKKINTAIYRIKDINKKLLTFVRQRDESETVVNVNELIDDLISGFFERELNIDNIKITRKFNTDIPSIITSSNQLRQVIINLINNAHDAIKSEGEIIIKTDYDDESIIIEVEDNGCGMTDEQLSKIFLPFYTTKPVGKGTGLGLSVSYSIVKNLGGSIDVKSELGKGTIFTIKLPYKK